MKRKSWVKRNKGAVIFLGIFALILVLGVVGTMAGIGQGRSGFGGGEYVATLHVEGTIAENSNSSLLSTGAYDHDYLIKTIDKLGNDPSNTGILLFINSPGGSVTASDEMYLALKEYKNRTHRPVYAYYHNMAASGGYYISMAADKIYADRNAWTGSIGVTIGSIYDATELLNKLGIRAVHIDSGVNKAMGSPTAPLTDEQAAIFKGLVDEAYEQFLAIVAEGRKMNIETLRPLADGRIYTARQAAALHLIDDVASLKSTKHAMEDSIGKKVEFREYKPIQKESFGSLFFKSDNEHDKVLNGLNRLIEKVEQSSTFNVSYISHIRK